MVFFKSWLCENPTALCALEENYWSTGFWEECYHEKQIGLFAKQMMENEQALQARSSANKSQREGLKHRSPTSRMKNEGFSRRTRQRDAKKRKRY